MDNITLIGMPGSGKSTVGVLLAKAMGYEFLDTDLVIQARQGMLLQQVLDTLGLEGFLDAEGEAICQVDTRRTVIAPGGSCICREEAMAHLKALGPVVYLRVPLEELERRLTNFATRGIAMEPGQTLAELYAARAPLYEKWADLVVDEAGDTLQQTAAAVLREITG